MAQTDKICQLGPPPEFGPGGEDPPVESEDLDLHSSLILSPVYDDAHLARVRLMTLIREQNNKKKSALRVEGKEADRLLRQLIDSCADYEGSPESENALSALLAMQMEGMNMTIWMVEIEKVIGDTREPVVLNYCKFWRRADPVTQLPPGASLQRRIEVKLGASESEYEELSRHLEVDVSPGLGRLSNGLAKKVGFKASLQAEQLVSESLTLTNTSDSSYRRFAFWHVVDSIQVFRLFSDDKDRLYWSKSDQIDIGTSSGISITYRDTA